MKRSKKISTQELQKIGIYHLDLLKAAGRYAKEALKNKKNSKESILSQLANLLEHQVENQTANLSPFTPQEGELWKDCVEKAMLFKTENQALKQTRNGFELKETPLSYAIFGKADIEKSAQGQMDTALRLPISVAGALMPDAHHGYGLPIGGVLATQADKIIPFAVGVDIACRMCLSVFEIEKSFFEKKQNYFKNLLLKNTCFGTGNGFQTPWDDPIFEKKEWQASPTIRQLKSKAVQQIGSSGTGNHFVEWGILSIEGPENALQLPVGEYVALLSHSGSRGFGAGVASHYSKLAMEITKLPAEAKHLAWLDLNTQEGQEYWIGMNLAGEYAAANHHHIHQRMAKDLNALPLRKVENHHNFAWQETLATGQAVMVHRKGATPAQKGELGIIPASMTQAGYVVVGKGDTTALASASHGAGRQMSRTQALKNISPQDLKRALIENDVTLIGADLDEAPMAYKDIEKVMSFQKDLVGIVGKFTPKIVRMAEKEVKRNKRQTKAGDMNFDES
ncbi:RtcB family protein [Hugenholtzia roseola]|uniref:RtcB family protein n=1 Tax=Hugenholtzia roseola TaxID=1002 RepID=UPI00041D495E|nr:RtcB family protein [Hugenholtzia roseola]